MASTTKQFHRLLRNIENFSDGQASIDSEKIDFDNDLDCFVVTIAPKDGPYRGGKFDFDIHVDEGFPEEAPRVECTTTIYHPNIDTSDNSICFSLLDEDWEPDLTLEDVVQGLLFLMYNPNISDPLSGFFSGCESQEEFELNVRKTLRGGEHFSEDFPRNLDPAYEDDGVTMEDAAVPCETKDVPCPLFDSDIESICADSDCGTDDESSDLEISLDWKVLEQEKVEEDRPARDHSFHQTLKSVGRRILRTAVEFFGKYG